MSEPSILPSDPVIASIESRLQRAERSVRRLRAALALVLTAALAGFAAQSTPSGVIEARGFVVRDAAGVVRAQLSADDNGAALGLFDSRGFLRVGLGAQPDGAILNLFTDTGSPRVVIGERTDSAFVILRDAEGAPRAAMAIQGDGSPSMYLLDDSLTPIWRAPERAR